MAAAMGAPVAVTGRSSSSSSRTSPVVRVGARAKAMQKPSVPTGPLQHRIGAALIGTGQRARESYGPAILQNPSFHLRALWSRTQTSAERFNLEVAGYSLEVFYGEDGFRELLTRPDIEGYAVALPPLVQPVFVARILAQQRHVLSEKPIASDRQSAEETLKRIEESGDNGMIWFISDPLRYEPIFSPSHLKLHELGPILAAEVYAVLVLERDELSRSNESLFIEGGVSHIALLRHVLGQITEVNCICISTHLETAVDKKAPQNSREAGGCFWKDALSGTLRFEGGTVATLNWQTSDSRQDERFRITFLGTKGATTVELDMGSQASAAGLRRYTLRRLFTGPGQSTCSLTLPRVFPAMGAERQVEAWGCAIRAFNERRQGSCSSGGGPRVSHCTEEFTNPNDHSPLNAIVNVMIVGAMLQSRGTTVQIRERPR